MTMMTCNAISAILDTYVIYIYICQERRVKAQYLIKYVFYLVIRHKFTNRACTVILNSRSLFVYGDVVIFNKLRICHLALIPLMHGKKANC